MQHDFGATRRRKMINFQTNINGARDGVFASSMPLNISGKTVNFRAGAAAPR